MPATPLLAALARQLALFACLLCVAAVDLLAQADECDDAIEIVASGAAINCSAASTSTTVGATASQPPTTCTSGANARDVWYKFTANTTGVGVRLDYSGASTALTSGAFEVYSGTCDALVSVPNSCSLGRSGRTFTGRVVNALSVGQEYFIRVWSQDDVEGTFELCTISVGGPGGGGGGTPNPTADCPGATLLCGSSAPLTIDDFDGSGADTDELPASGCFPTNAEDASAWFVFTAASAGALQLRLDPADGGVVDFAVFELPGGNCAQKRLLRCVSTGTDGCTGPAGLRAGVTGVSAGPNCSNDPVADRFLAPLDVTAGTTYALFVNRYGASPGPVTLDFAGTDFDFVGPDTRFTATQVSSTCNAPVYRFTVTAPVASGTYAWDFGPDATPPTSTATSQTVTFGPGTGPRMVDLTVDDGTCEVTTTETVDIVTDFDIAIAIEDETAITCANPNGGGFTAVPTPAGTYVYTVSDGSDGTLLGTSGDGTFTALPAGDHVLTVTASGAGGATGCSEDFPVTVRDASDERDFAVDTLATRATDCSGPASGGVTLGVTPSGDYTYTLNGVTQTSGVFDAVPAGTNIVDVEPTGVPGCAVAFTFEIRDGALATELDSDIEIGSPGGECDRSRFSFAVAAPEAGAAYIWNFGQDAIPNAASGVGPHDVIFVGATGVRAVSITETLGGSCGGVRDTLVEYVSDGDFILDPVVRPVGCGEVGTGAIEAEVTPPGDYRYALDGGPEQSDPTFPDLDVGTYTVSVWRAALGPACAESRNVTVEEDLSAGTVFGEAEVSGASCVGVANGAIEFLDLPAGSTLTRLDSGDDNDPAAPPTATAFDGLLAGVYRFRLAAPDGCARDTSIVVEAGAGPQLDLGPDQRVPFGEFVSVTPVFVAGRAAVNPDSVRYEGLDSTPTQLLSLGGIVFQPTRFPRQAVTVTVTDEDGCVASDVFVAEVRIDRTFQAPTAFTPNGDGVNDVWYLRARPSVRIIRRVQVFSRWGSRVYGFENFEPNDERIAWDGRINGEEADAGVYAWVAEVEFEDGSTRTVTGELHLIR